MLGVKETIRRGVFETNSSSTHSLTMCTEEEYQKWKDGELYISYWDGNFITKEEYEEKGYSCTCEDEDDCYCDIEYYSYSKFWDRIRDEYETFHEEKNGVVAFGYYGYDN